MVFDFLRNNDSSELTENKIFDTLNELEQCSIMVQFELMKGNWKWHEDRVQSFIPLILNLTNFEWLELIAKYECHEDYEAIKKFLDHAQNLMKNGNEILRKGIDNNGM